ncbi:hypothetical protein SLE2022_171100 [Rubroshorea leprosula]
MAAPTLAVESVQCFGRKKTAVAVTYYKRGKGLIKINGCPIELVEPEILRFKAIEPILLLRHHRFNGVNMRIFCQRWRAHLTDLRDQAEHRQGSCRLVPKVCG